MEDAKFEELGNTIGQFAESVAMLVYCASCNSKIPANRAQRKFAVHAVGKKASFEMFSWGDPPICDTCLDDLEIGTHIEIRIADKKVT